jgi:hypothetical protein
VNVQRKRISEETVAYHVARALARSEGSPRRISTASGSERGLRQMASWTKSRSRDVVGEFKK